MKRLVLLVPAVLLGGCLELMGLQPSDGVPVELPQHCTQLSLNGAGDTTCDGMACDASTAICDTAGCSCTAFALPPEAPDSVYQPSKPAAPHEGPHHKPKKKGDKE